MSAQALADQHKPFVLLHPRESNNPIDVETYLTASELLDGEDGNIIIPAPLNSQILDDNKNTIPDGATLRIIESKEDEIKAGTPNTALNTVPFYCRFKETTDFIYLTYIFVYGYNWNYPVFFNWFPTGAHWSDFEHVTLELEINSLALTRVYFGAHRKVDGKWVDAADVKMTDGRVTVYSSRGSHGCYYEESFYLRAGGFANDSVGTATPWIADTVFLVYDDSQPEYVPSTMGFLTFDGTWGNGKITGMQRKFFWNAPETGDESEAPWTSSVNWLTEWFIVAALIAVVLGVSIWAIVEFAVPKDQGPVIVEDEMVKPVVQENECAKGVDMDSELIEESPEMMTTFSDSDFGSDVEIYSDVDLSSDSEAYL